MNETNQLGIPQMASPNQNKPLNAIRCGSSSSAQRSLKSNSKPLSLFPSDFFSSADEESTQPQKTNTLSQPILPNNTVITIAKQPSQVKSIPSKVIIDFQKEFDEDRELLELLQGEKNPRPNSEEHSVKPFSSRPKRLNKKQVECEIIPEVDEEKMRTSTKIFFEDNASNKANTNNLNFNINIHFPCNSNNPSISPKKVKALKSNEKSNESLSTTNVTYDSMKPKSKMKRRYHSGDTKTSKMNLIAVNFNFRKAAENPADPPKQLVLPSIKKKNPYTEYQRKFENLFDNLGEFSEEEHIKPKLNKIMQNTDIKTVFMKAAFQRDKMGSAPHSDANYLKKSPSTSCIPQICKSKMSLNYNYQQEQLKMKKTTTNLNGSNNRTKPYQNNSKGSPSPHRCDFKKELVHHQMITYKHKQFPVKLIPK